MEMLRIGRHPDNDIRLADSSVSRHHAALSGGEGSWHLVDLDTTNGTWIRRQGEWVRVADIRLGANAVVRFGDFTTTIPELLGPGNGEAPPAPVRPAAPRPVSAVPVAPPSAMVRGDVTLHDRAGHMARDSLRDARRRTGAGERPVRRAAERPARQPARGRGWRRAALAFVAIVFLAGAGTAGWFAALHFAPGTPPATTDAAGPPAAD